MIFLQTESILFLSRLCFLFLLIDVLKSKVPLKVEYWTPSLVVMTLLQMQQACSSFPLPTKADMQLLGMLCGDCA